MFGQFCNHPERLPGAQPMILPLIRQLKSQHALIPMMAFLMANQQEAGMQTPFGQSPMGQPGQQALPSQPALPHLPQGALPHAHGDKPGLLPAKPEAHPSGVPDHPGGAPQPEDIKQPENTTQASTASMHSAEQVAASPEGTAAPSTSETSATENPIQAETHNVASQPQDPPVNQTPELAEKLPVPSEQMIPEPPQDRPPPESHLEEQTSPEPQTADQPDAQQKNPELIMPHQPPPPPVALPLPQTPGGVHPEDEDLTTLQQGSAEKQALATAAGQGTGGFAMGTMHWIWLIVLITLFMIIAMMI